MWKNPSNLFILAITVVLTTMAQAPSVTCNEFAENDFRITATMSPIPYEALLSSPTETVFPQPDIDLHAYVENGGHVGVDYAIDNEEHNYKVGITNALCSGDMWQGTEWISIPLSAHPRFIVVSENDHSDNIQVYLFEISICDSNNNAYSKYKTSFVQAGHAIEHTYLINLKSDGTYEILLDNEVSSTTEPESIPIAVVSTVVVLVCGLSVLFILLLKR